MCLPLGCTKTLVGLTALIITIGGLAILIVSLVAFTRADIFAGAGAILQDTITTLKYVILILGCCLFLVGFFGVYGAYRKNSFCLTIYGIIITIASLAFLIVGIYGLAKTMSNQYLDDLQSKIPSPSNLFYNQSLFVQTSANALCSSSCPCYLTNDTYLQIKNITNDFNTSNIPKPFVSTTNKSSGAVKMQQCSQFNNLSKIQQNFITSMSLLESDFGCTGVFTATPYYVFTNINNDYQQIGTFPTCAADLEDTIQTYGKRIGYVCLIIFGILFLNAIFSCCICCHPDERDRMKKSMPWYSNDKYQRV